MARVTKDAEVRREELLDVAVDLCMKVGFEGMSVEQVTTAAGVAKGTFYHYFESKQALLWQLVDRFGDALFSYLESEMGQVDGDALERMRALMRLSSQWKMEHVDSTMTYVPFLCKEENYTLRHKLYSAWLERTRPLLLDIVEDGAREGIFSVSDAEAATDIVLSIWFDFGNRLWLRALDAPDGASYADILGRGATGMFEAEERILGAPEGSLRVNIDPSAIDSTCAMLTKSDGSGMRQTDRMNGRRQ